VPSARKIPPMQARLCNIKVLPACRSTVVIHSRCVSCKPYTCSVLFAAGLAFCSPLLRNGSLMLPLRSYAYRITSRTERLLVLPPSINRHSAAQHSPPLRPACSDNLLSRLSRNPRTPCLVHLVMPVLVAQIRGVPLAG
jgi:hypothetical protein